MPAGVEATSKRDERENEGNVHTKKQDAIVTPEGHNNAGTLVDCEGLHVPKSSSLPNADLPIAHLAEPSRRDAIVLSHPNNPRTLDTAMAFSDTDRISTSPRVEETELLVSTRGCENGAGQVERERLYGITVAVQGGARTRRISEIPEFHEMLAGCGGENVGSSWVPENLADFLGAHVDPRDGLQVLRFPSVRGPTIEEAVRDFPKERSTVF